MRLCLPCEGLGFTDDAMCTVRVRETVAGSGVVVVRLGNVSRSGAEESVATF